MRELEHNVYSYLPGLMESGYAGLMAMRGSVTRLIPGLVPGSVPEGDPGTMSPGFGGGGGEGGWGDRGGAGGVSVSGVHASFALLAAAGGDGGAAALGLDELRRGWGAGCCCWCRGCW